MKFLCNQGLLDLYFIVIMKSNNRKKNNSSLLYPTIGTTHWSPNLRRGINPTPDSTNQSDHATLRPTNRGTGGCLSTLSTWNAKSLPNVVVLLLAYRNEQTYTNLHNYVAYDTVDTFVDITAKQPWKHKTSTRLHTHISRRGIKTTRSN